MSIDPTFGASPVGALAGAGQSGGATGSIADAVRALAGDVVGQVAGNLGLIDRAPLGQGDIYHIAPLADGIAVSLGDSSAASIGALTRALEDFAGAVASDMAAYADGKTLELADAALRTETLSQAGDVAGVIQGLDRAIDAFDSARTSSPPA
ncbi:hypothetical protein [Sphingobium aromaticiconvertens]|uniref:hypothetical protein n=1 Tax=Sphingobium aromaticiconvertens TaxID=365341 RepID=UPI00301864AF